MKLLEMSIFASVLIVLLIILRAFVLQKLPKKIFVLLWMVVMVRLICPFELPISGGIATPVMDFLHKLSRQPETDYGKAVAVAAGRVESKTADNMRDGLTAAVFPVWKYIWFIGTVGCGIWFLYFFLKEYRLLAQALPMQKTENQKLQGFADTSRRLAGLQRGRIFTHDRIATPLAAGIIMPRVVLPKNMAQSQKQWMKYVLTHEMVHIRRRDNFWKLISAAAVCIHWYNPFVWMMYLLFARDLELSCDEKVIALYGETSREEYALTLLELVREQQKQTLFCCGFGKNPTKERIVAIMKYKKLTGIKALCAVILLAGATTVFAANGESAAETGGQEALLKAAEAQAEVEKNKAAETELTKSQANVQTEGSDQTILEKNNQSVQIVADVGNDDDIKSAADTKNDDDIKLVKEKETEEAKNAEQAAEDAMAVAQIITLNDSDSTMYFTIDSNAEKQTYQYSLADMDKLTEGVYFVEVGGKTYKITISADGGTESDLSVEVQNQEVGNAQVLR